MKIEFGKFLKELQQKDPKQSSVLLNYASDAAEEFDSITGNLYSADGKELLGIVHAEAHLVFVEPVEAPAPEPPVE